MSLKIHRDSFQRDETSKFNDKFIKNFDDSDIRYFFEDDIKIMNISSCHIMNYHFFLEKWRFINWKTRLSFHCQKTLCCIYWNIWISFKSWSKTKKKFVEWLDLIKNLVKVMHYYEDKSCKATQLMILKKISLKRWTIRCLEKL